MSRADIIAGEEPMRTILGLVVALALFVAGCTAAATSTSAPEKTQRTEAERNRESQGGGY